MTRTAARPASPTSPTSLSSRNHQPPGTFQNRIQITHATHYYEAGTSLWEVQKILGDDWTTTTVRYILTAQGDPERASLEAAGRARQRLAVDTGRLW